MDAVLLSGGLDSSIAALLGGGLWTKAYCVTLPGAPDGAYARAVADHLGLDLRPIEVTVEELAADLEPVTRALASFDPMEIRNAVVPYTALRRAREDGVETLATGDGADELFAGYSYMTELADDELDAYRRQLVDEMRFSTLGLAEDLGVGAGSVFLGAAVRELALELHASELVAEHGGRTWGKLVLREAFADELPEPVRWQRKDPIEKGSGSRALVQHFAKRFDADELAAARRRAREEGVELRDGEHAAYYEAYREHHPPPAETAGEADGACEGCGAGLAGTYCRVCGHQNPPAGEG